MSKSERTPSVGTTRPEKCKSIQRCECSGGVEGDDLWTGLRSQTLKTRNHLKNKVFPAPSRRTRFLVHVLKVATRRKAVKRNRCFGTNFLPRLSRSHHSDVTSRGLQRGREIVTPRLSAAVCKLYPKHCLTTTTTTTATTAHGSNRFRWIGHVTTM